MVPPTDSMGRFPAALNRQGNETGVVTSNLTYESFCGRHTPNSSNDFQYASSASEDNSQNHPSGHPPDRLPYQFIDQQELQQPNGSSLRNTVRSHARRDADLRRQHHNNSLIRSLEHPRRLLGKEPARGNNLPSSNTTSTPGVGAQRRGSSQRRGSESDSLYSRSTEYGMQNSTSI
jgi:hypothetical protein